MKSIHQSVSRIGGRHGIFCRVGGATAVIIIGASVYWVASFLPGEEYIRNLFLLSMSLIAVSVLLGRNGFMMSIVPSFFILPMLRFPENLDSRGFFIFSAIGISSLIRTFPQAKELGVLEARSLSRSVLLFSASLAFVAAYCKISGSSSRILQFIAVAIPLSEFVLSARVGAASWMIPGGIWLWISVRSGIPLYYFILIVVSFFILSVLSWKKDKVSVDTLDRVTVAAFGFMAAQCINIWYPWLDRCLLHSINSIDYCLLPLVTDSSSR